MKIPVKMRRQFLILVLTLGLVAGASLPEVATYAKVTKNGEVTNRNQSGGPLTWLINTFSMSNKTMDEVDEGRSDSGISITVSPVYVPPKIPELQKGEAVDYPTTKRYSTLDEEMLARLDSQSRRIQAQDRFHPPASFEHDIAHGNAARLKQASSSSGSASSSSSSSSPSSAGPSGPLTGPSQDSRPGSSAGSSGYSSPDFPGSYDYKPPSFINAKPQSFDSYSKPDAIPKVPSSYDSASISYNPSPDSYGPPADYPDPGHDQDHDDEQGHGPPDFDPELTREIHSSSYGAGPIYGASVPPKPIEYASHFDHPAFVDDPYIHGHDDHHDIIYDHIPEDHTPAPEMMDQRVNKKPYSYYFIGKKLWYVPLYFSIYFIFYIAALILKSIARHKINFPTALSAAVHGRSSASDSNGIGWLDTTVRVLEGIETARKAFSNKKS